MSKSDQELTPPGGERPGQPSEPEQPRESKLVIGPSPFPGGQYVEPRPPVEQPETRPAEHIPGKVPTAREALKYLGPYFPESGDPKARTEVAPELQPAEDYPLVEVVDETSERWQEIWQQLGLPLEEEAEEKPRRGLVRKTLGFLRGTFGPLLDKRGPYRLVRRAFLSLGVGGTAALVIGLVASAPVVAVAGGAALLVTGVVGRVMRRDHMAQRANLMFERLIGRGIRAKHMVVELKNGGERLEISKLIPGADIQDEEVELRLLGDDGHARYVPFRWLLDKLRTKELLPVDILE